MTRREKQILPGAIAIAMILGIYLGEVLEVVWPRPIPEAVLPAIQVPWRWLVLPIVGADEIQWRRRRSDSWLDADISKSVGGLDIGRVRIPHPGTGNNVYVRYRSSNRRRWIEGTDGWVYRELRL